MSSEQREQLLFDGATVEEEYTPIVNTATKGQAIAPFIIGLLAVVGLFVPTYGVYIAFVLSILGTALGARGARKGSSLARIGQILSVAALVVSSIVLIVAIAMGALTVNSFLRTFLGR